MFHNTRVAISICFDMRSSLAIDIKGVLVGFYFDKSTLIINAFVYQ